MDNYLDLIKLVLPEMLVSHFDLTNSVKKGEVLHLRFKELNIIPLKDSSLILVSKGFHKEITIQDFPLRGNVVYFHVKRRRWIDKITKEVVQRDWNIVAQGTRMTTEFAAFLKGISQY